MKTLLLTLTLSAGLAAGQQRPIAEAVIRYVTVVNVATGEELKDQTARIQASRIDGRVRAYSACSPAGGNHYPARFLGRTAESGTVEPGKIANLVLLRADPLANIHNRAQIEGVWLQSKHFDGAALAHMLERAKPTAKQ